MYNSQSEFPELIYKKDDDGLLLQTSLFFLQISHTILCQIQKWDISTRQYKMRTRHKMQNADCRLSTKRRLRRKMVFFFFFFSHQYNNLCIVQVAKSNWLPVKITTYLVSVSQLLCLVQISSQMASFK